MARIVIKALWYIGSEGWGGMRGHNSTEEYFFLDTVGSRLRWYGCDIAMLECTVQCWYEYISYRYHIIHKVLFADKSTFNP